MDTRATTESTIARPTPARKTPLWRIARSFVLGALAGGALGWGGKLAGGALPSLDVDAWHVVSVLAWLAVAVFLHELGHALGGRAAGMRPLMFAAGPVRVTRTVHGWQWSRHSLRHGLLGFVSMLPDPSRPFAPQLRALAAGGPLASLACAVVAGVAAISLDGALRFHALAFMATSLLVLVMTAVPMRVGGMETDGAQLLDLARGGRGTQVKAIVMGLTAQSLSGVRPRDLDGRLISEGVALAEGDPTLDPSMRAFPLLLAALHADDAGDTGERDTRMARVAGLVSDVLPAMRAQFALELAWHAAMRGDVDAAVAWRAEAVGGITDACDRHRVDAAISYLEGKADDARRSMRAAREGLQRNWDPGGAKWARDQLDRLEARLVD